MKTLKYPLFIFAILFTFNSSADNNANDSWNSEPTAQFRELKSVKGKNFMISTADSLASEAGAEILAKGGNAIDAAIAAQLVLNVVEPQSAGIGGGGFLIYFDAKTKKMKYYNGRERAPAKAHEKMFLDETGTPRNFTEALHGGLSVGVPGLLKILKEAHDEHGKIPFNELFQPAIRLAENGFIMDKVLHDLVVQTVYLKDFDETANIYLDENLQPKTIGSIIKNPDLAETFKNIADSGIEIFYQGKIANDIVAKVQNSKINPGYLSLEDLKNYQSIQGQPICGNYRKYKICSMPLPSSGGITLLQILGILENFDLSDFKPNSAKAIHLISEATRLAYADRNEYLGDNVDAPVSRMLDKNYLKKRSELINLETAMAEVKPGKFVTIYKFKPINENREEKPSTTHLSIIDSEGNAVTLTSSIEYFFGSAMSVNGFLLNNQLTDFSFLPEIDGKKVANRVEPNKQPRSSMTPTFVFDENNNLIMITGSPGGPRIIQFVLKSIIAVLDWDMDVQEAASLPNFVVLKDVIELEKNTDLIKAQGKLEKMGHQVKIVDITSGIHAITISNDNLKGASDPRRSGAAIGK